ncbi:MAG: hypothetical protein KDA83_12770 [Planctomycetales bacterium]|nr:hypothetical protein [Planctomycetales bacterium]
MTSNQYFALLRAAPFAGILCVSADMKLFSSLGVHAFLAGEDFNVERLSLFGLAIMDLLVAATLLVISSLGMRRLSAAITTLLFASFAAWHSIYLKTNSHDCGCFGLGNYSSHWMFAGCLFLSLAGLPEILRGKSLISTIWFLLALGTGFASFSQARVADATEPKLLSLCEHQGRSFPLESTEITSGSSVLVLSGTCPKCRDFLADRGLISKSEAGNLSGYLLVVKPDAGNQQSVFRLTVSREYLISTPVVILLDHGLIAECFEPKSLDSF